MKNTVVKTYPNGSNNIKYKPMTSRYLYSLARARRRNGEQVLVVQAAKDRLRKHEQSRRQLMA